MASSGWGHLESGLPGEWAALILVLVGVTILGGVVIAAVCLGHERTVLHRASARAARASAQERDWKRERDLRLSRTREEDRFYQLQGSGDSKSGHAA
jgi:hypothetical protein